MQRLAVLVCIPDDADEEYSCFVGSVPGHLCVQSYLTIQVLDYYSLMNQVLHWIPQQNTVRQLSSPAQPLHLKLGLDLFGRLRELRGNKTMLFSSHRFGNLTRHADLIL